MRTLFLCFLLFYLPSALLAQNSKNYMSVDLQSSLNFYLNSSWDIENTQTVNNAIRIKLRTKDRNCHVYARVYYIWGNTSTTLTPDYLQLRHSSTTTPGNHLYYLNSNDISLSYSNQLLFHQKKNGGTRYHYYDFKLKPIGYEINPGNYYFYLLFTMSQP